jgi:carbonic anhydrase/acetyltransferase-like protein (isoleucine patch superfamily)
MRGSRWFGGAALVLAVLGTSGSAFANGGSAAGGAATCQGGSVAAGSYSSLTISGPCAIDAGSVSVAHNVTVLPGAALFAAFGGSDLTVGQNLDVQSDAVLVLGCEPEAFACLNDPDQVVGTLSTNDSIGGSLTAENALAVLAHHNSVGRNVVLSGGGGGFNCDPQSILFGSPAFATFEDNTIGGNAVIAGWESCWLGFIRNTVANNVNFTNNSTADPDGNEVVTNTIGGGLNCSGNSPAPQVGDSEGTTNQAARATGQCVGLVAP